jgi:gallate dioxygenase
MAVAIYELDLAGEPPPLPKKERSNEQLTGIEDIEGTHAFDVGHSVKAINPNRFFWRHREPAFRALAARHRGRIR